MSDFNKKEDQNNILSSEKTKQKRRTRKDENNRDYLCGCGKKYLSYPALYTHLKQKHKGEAPQGTQNPSKGESHRGRPKKPDVSYNENNQTDSDDFSEVSDSPLDDLLYFFSELQSDWNKNNPENQVKYIQESMVEQIDPVQCFPVDIFNHEEANYCKLLTAIKNYQQIQNIDPLQLKCTQIFGNYLVNISKHLKAEPFKEVVFYLALYWRAINEYGSKYKQFLNENELENKDFSDQVNGDVIAEISNDFQTQYFNQYYNFYKEKVKDFKIFGSDERKQRNSIYMIYYFCQWIYTKKYSSNKLKLDIDEKEDES